MAFMIPQYTKERMWLVETSYGTEVVPADLLPKSWQKVEIITLGPESEGFEAVFDYIEGSDPGEMTLIKGKWFARLSAPGYMDATDWHGPFDTMKEAKQDIEDSYDVDPDTGDELEENPRCNPSRHDVVNAWKAGRPARTATIWTDGKKLYSYDLLIGNVIRGKRVVYDYTGPHRVSQTTATHVNAAKAVADVVRKPPKGRAGQVKGQTHWGFGNPKGRRPPKGTLYITWSSVFDDPSVKYDIKKFSSTLKQAGATEVWSDSAFGWANQPKVVLFRGLSERKASQALKKLPQFKRWGVIIQDAHLHWKDNTGQQNPRSRRGKKQGKKNPKGTKRVTNVRSLVARALK